ncbi:MAG: NUDIX domain-containing protein [Candidatus Micrarchaeota archaeon]|nr:NUDIX domain-containing protein [Candidatus Micrarchaeota archaeon]
MAYEPREDEVEITTGAFIIRDGKIFLTTGPKFNNKWTVPGGHVNYRETSKDCIEREVKEELGIKCKAIELFSVSERTHHTVRGKDRHFIFLNWKCEITEEPKIDGKEHDKAKWINIEDALDDPEVMSSVKEPLKVLLKLKNAR